MKQKGIWITGGGSGIGLEVARKFQKEGWKVAISGRNEKRLREAAKNFADVAIVPRDVAIVPCDVRSEESVREAYQQVKAAIGSVDVLLSNAGIGEYGSFEEILPQDFEDMMMTNVYGSFLTIQAVLGDMIANHSGTIVQMLSIASKKTFAGGAAYGASKFGAYGMIGSLREDVRAKGIKVIGIMPGAADTEIWSEGTRQELGYRMMLPSTIAYIIYHAVMTPDDAMIEEIIIRPQLGDL